MEPDRSPDLKEIARMRRHVDDAIAASPCTFVTLRPDRIVELACACGRDPQGRIWKFQLLCNDARRRFEVALARCARDTYLNRRIKEVYKTAALPSDVTALNHDLNSLYAECGMEAVMRDFEEVAVACNASMLYGWAEATTLSRHVGDHRELDSMLSTGLLQSTGHNFVSTSLTQSPWLSYRCISLNIRVTDAYRARASPVKYTSEFAVADPEEFRGYKSTDFLEGAVRLENGTPVEDGTLDIVFHHGSPPPESLAGSLAERYAPLGPVRIRCGGQTWDAATDALWRIP